MITLLKKYNLPNDKSKWTQLIKKERTGYPKQLRVNLENRMLSPFYSINRYDMIRQIRKDELHLLKDDPVRPHIELDWRTRPGKEVFVLDDNGEITAVVCVAYMDEVPASEHELRWSWSKYCSILYSMEL